MEIIPIGKDLVSFMTSGPIVVQVLEGDNAIALNREVMGATNPAEAAEGTIRKEFAESIDIMNAYLENVDKSDLGRLEIEIYDMIINKTILWNQDHISGYLINKDNYYLFQPFLLEDESIPLYYRMNLIHKPIKHI